MVPPVSSALNLPFAWLLGVAKLFSVQEHHVLSRH